MTSIKELSPQKVWHYFHAITQIPRPSKHEEKMAEYILQFAKEFNLEAIQDKTGNILIRKDATKGRESSPIVILQSHMDMVCEKDSHSNHNFMSDPIETVIDGDWVKAKETTLGADDGIGMAAQLAILASQDLQHGPLEALFTVDEETGLTGAFDLDETLLTGSVLINLDSEDNGEIFIGCAGGVDTIGTYTPQYETTPAASFAFKISVSGLTGGHSGDDIIKGLGNANKILVRFLWNAQEELGLRTTYLQGGNLRNAIAREAEAYAIVPNKNKEEIRVLLNCYLADLEDELGKLEPNLKIHLQSAKIPKEVFTISFQHQFLHALYSMPHGVMAMSQTIPGLVETSTNLASVKIKEKQIIVATSQRSSIESKKKDIANQVASLFRLSGADVNHTDGYPGWTPNAKSKIVTIAAEAYKSLFNEEPEIKAIHAGLECGLFLKKYPGLDMVSIGPTIKGAHSPNERLKISTVEKFWKHLVLILKTIS